jgi:hypothetical protein
MPAHVIPPAPQGQNPHNSAKHLVHREVSCHHFDNNFLCRVASVPQRIDLARQPFTFQALTTLAGFVLRALTWSEERSCGSAASQLWKTRIVHKAGIESR